MCYVNMSQIRRQSRDLSAGPGAADKSVQTLFVDVLHGLRSSTAQQDSGTASADHAEIRALREENAALHEKVACLLRLRNQESDERHMLPASDSLQVLIDCQVLAEQSPSCNCLATVCHHQSPTIGIQHNCTQQPTRQTHAV